MPGTSRRHASYSEGCASLCGAEECLTGRIWGFTEGEFGRPYGFVTRLTDIVSIEARGSEASQDRLSLSFLHCRARFTIDFTLFNGVAFIMRLLALCERQGNLNPSGLEIHP